MISLTSLMNISKVKSVSLPWVVNQLQRERSETASLLVLSRDYWEEYYGLIVKMNTINSQPNFIHILIFMPFVLILIAK